MTHLTEEQLNDLADGAQDASALVHLDTCATCRDELEQVRTLLAAVQALPRGVSPARDLLPDIHAAIDQQQLIPLVAASKPVRTRFLSSSLPHFRASYLAAAAILLIITTAVVTRALMQRAESHPRWADRAATDVRLVGNDVRQLEQKYENAIVELQALIEAQRARLSPSTVRLLEENLLVIDRAIRESRAALEQDPSNDLINEWLRTAYERKLDLLRRATAVTAT
ncbi:MAG: hypothetical protein ACRENP_15855 [Longimicrobiales bacterium]